MKDIKELKVGDIVVEYIPNDNRWKPKESTVTKIGKKYFYVNAGYGRDVKYDINYGYGEYGMQVFPGTLEELNTFEEENQLLRDLINDLNHFSGVGLLKYQQHLTKNQIEEIRNILNKK